MVILCDDCGTCELEFLGVREKTIVLWCWRCAGTIELPRYGFDDDERDFEKYIQMVCNIEGERFTLRDLLGSEYYRLTLRE
jgi:hypothetical protein